MAAVFLGTPAAAVPSLTALANVDDIELVVTQPDRPSGRGGRMTPSPVKVAAEQFGFAIAQPSSPEELFDIISAGGFGFGLVVAFGHILTPAMLALPAAGFLNVHFSLLPRWRGAAPVERAIAEGDEKTGVTLMKIDTGLDTGPVLGEIATLIGSDETGGSLTARLAYLGASLVDSVIPDVLNGSRRPVPQIATGATYASKLSRADAQLFPESTTARAERTVRAFTPRPGAWVDTPDGPLGIREACTVDADVAPGTIMVHESTVLAGFADGALQVLSVQPAGKQRTDASSWMNGRRGESTMFHAKAE